MDATAELNAVSHATRPPAFTRKYAGLNLWTMTLIIAALAAVGLDYMLFTGRITLPGHEAFTVRAAAVALVVMNFGLVLCYAVGKLKEERLGACRESGRTGVSPG